MNRECFEFSALIEAWREMRRWAEAHPDLARYCDLRYRAFATAFGVDLDACPEIAPAPPEWLTACIGGGEHPCDEHWHQTIHAFADSADRDSRRLSGPFAGYLELPPGIAALYEQFGASIAEPLAAAAAAIGDLLATIFVALYPEAANRVVRAHDLAAHGFDPRATAPDPYDYF